VFAPKAKEVLDNETLNFIGVVNSEWQNNSFTLRKYIPYLLLYAILAITQYVFSSEKYAKFLETYQLLQIRGLEGEQDEVPLINEEQKRQLGLADSITKFLGKGAIYLLCLALFIECSLLPVSLLNFVLLLFLAWVVFKFFRHDNQLDMYKSMPFALGFLKIVAFLILFLKYMFQFEKYAEQKYQLAYKDLSLIQKLLGIENTDVPIKLFALAMVLVITNLQQKFLKYKYLEDILREEQADWNRLEFYEAKDRNKKWRNCWHYAGVIFYFALLKILPLLQISAVLVYSLLFQTVIGGIYVVVALLSLYRHQSN